ncbi:MAG: FAD-linked oxidase C-terminal domain-containing protein [candidate division Zixibacteria bacterium]|nr:FAD-linked oxidase C-terminal domain-containing protein [candidate division Zixibacteria bacterium]
MNQINFELLRKKLESPDSLILDLSDKEKYFHDATNHNGTPLAIVMAKTESDITDTILFCKSNNINIVPRGAGTGLSGGCVPVENSILLSTEQIDYINIDPIRSRAVCGPGVITKDLVDMAANFNLTYPPDPASFDESTLGGNVAENAGGLRCKKYGVTRDYILGLKVIDKNGKIIKTGCYNNYKGFNLTDILIGSEGTLVIIAEISVQLIDLPKIGDTILATFNNPKDCANTVFDIVRSGLIPTVMEFLDSDAAACSNEYEKNEGIDQKAAGILLIETSFENRETETSKIEKICNKNSCSYLEIEPDQNKADNLWKIRRNLSKASKEIASLRISEDIVVPVSKFPELVSFVSEMNQESEIRINSFGHAGDGNLHVNFLSNDTSHKNRIKIGNLIKSLMIKTLELGGSLSGEHGIGIEKKQFLPMELNLQTLNFMIAFKNLFDPDNYINPNKIF